MKELTGPLQAKKPEHLLSHPGYGFNVKCPPTDSCVQTLGPWLVAVWGGCGICWMVGLTEGSV